MSAIVTDWIEGRGLPDVPVIDGHIHIGEWPHNATFRSVDEAAERAVEFLDASGVDAFCALSGGYLSSGADYRRGNDFLLAVWEKLPDRLIPFPSLNPNDTRENVLSEVERMHRAGVRCVKLINSYQERHPGDGPVLMAVYEFAAQHGMLIGNHAWEQDAILRIPELSPTVDFVYAHYGASADSVIAVRPNVYANIWGFGNMGWLDRGIGVCGAEKFMLGSDGFLNCLSVGIGPVVFADIPDDWKRLILGLSCARLLEKVGALPEPLKRKAGLVEAKGAAA